MSLTALQAAKARHQTALTAHYARTVIIGSVICQTAVQIGGIEQRPASDGRGFTPVQILTTSILKRLLPTAPASRSLLRCDGLDWRIDTVSGHDDCEVAWAISAVRFPTA
jgi:hypothetical protein